MSDLLPRIELTLLRGQHAQAWHLKGRPLALTGRVKDWRVYWPGMLPLPHPGPHNNRWLRQNPWFASELLPALQARVRRLLQQKA